MAKKPDTSRKRKELTRLAVVLVVLFLILGAFILYLALPLISGTAVVLAIRPVDPFDPLRGQYMSIAYEIGLLDAVPGVGEGDTVYVSLAPDSGGIWRENGVTTYKVDGTFIKGKVKAIRGERMTVEYGIEQYFFEKGATFPNVPVQEVTVGAKVDSKGRARVVRFLHNGKPIKIQYRRVALTS